MTRLIDKIKKCLLCALLLLFEVLLFAQEPSEQPDSEEEPAPSGLVITEFNITGLKRTQNRYMQSLLSKFKGAEVSSESLSTLETTLQAENLFSEIKVSVSPVSETQAAVNISLKEKLSFLPLPFAMLSDGIFRAGLFVIDMNAFGVHDTFLAGGLYSEDMMMGLGVYSKQPHKKGDFGFSSSFSVFKRDTLFTDGHEHKEFEYNSLLLGTDTKLLFKPADSTSVYFGIGYNFFDPNDSDPVIKMNQWTVSGGWSIKKSSWNGIFLSSNGISAGGTIHFTDDTDYRTGQSLSASAQFQLPVIPTIRLLGFVQGFASNNLYYPYYANRMTVGVSILSADFRTQNIMGLYGGAEFFISRIPFIGMLSAYAVYQAAFAEDWDKSLYVGHGPEAGVRIYLAKIAFPAFSMGGSYNVTNRSWQYSIALGASF